MVRIAVATTDEIVVNSHFGRATNFRIVDVNADDDSLFYVESRATTPICKAGGHDDLALNNTIEGLKDCNVVLAERIGLGALRALEQAGIEGYEIPGEISASIAQLIRYRKVKALFN